MALAGLLVVAAAGCGRSAPEGAAPEGAEGEPAAAGVQVVSEVTVASPSPTTAPTSTQPAPTTVTTVPPSPAGTYVVEAGDTLSSIAARFSVTVDAISQANGITDVNSIRPGQELIIPGG